MWQKARILDCEGSRQTGTVGFEFWVDGPPEKRSATFDGLHYTGIGYKTNIVAPGGIMFVPADATELLDEFTPELDLISEADWMAKCKPQ